MVSQNKNKKLALTVKFLIVKSKHFCAIVTTSRECYFYTSLDHRICPTVKMPAGIRISREVVDSQGHIMSTTTTLYNFLGGKQTLIFSVSNQPMKFLKTLTKKKKKFS